MTSHRPKRTHAASGMTLVEILVAVSVATVIAAVMLSVYFTVTASIRRRQEGRWPAALAALEVVRRDLACCLPTAADGTDAFVLECEYTEAGTNFTSSLLCSTAVVPAGQEDLNRFDVERVRYTLEDSSTQATGGVLLRESRALTGPATLAPPVTNVLLRNASGFQLMVLDRAAWTNRWKTTVRQPLPRAARVRLAWTNASGTESLSAWVLIPAGNVIGVASNAAGRAPAQRPTTPAATRSPSRPKAGRGAF
jgi:type II secretory pathway pseudopilin PulG